MREVVVTLDGARRATAVLAGAIAVGFGLLEVLRVWLPSVLFVLGDAGSTSAVTLALFGLLCLGIAPVAGALVGRTGPLALWRVGAGALVVGRAVLVFDPPGSLRLTASSVAVVGATIAIVALAAGGRADQNARLGLLTGLVAASCLHVGTRTLGLVWPATVASAVASSVLVLLLAAALWHAGSALRDDAADPQMAAALTPRLAPAWSWWVLTPLLLLVSMVSGVPGRMAVATGWSAPVVAATTAGAHIAAILAALLARRLGPARAGLLAAAAISGGTAAALDAVGWRGVIGQILLVLGLGLLVGSDLGATGQPSSDRRRGVVAGLSPLAFGAVSALYYAAYDIHLPFNNRLLLLGTALFGSALALATFRLGRSATTRSVLASGALLRGGLVAGLIVALVAVGARPPTVQPAGEASPEFIRLATYNIRFGFDLDGRFAAEQQADLLRDAAPDVVVLNEVDRGWLTSGGHDALEVFAAELGLPHVLFSRAADEVWGNALLSRFPITEVASERLPGGSDPMPRSHFVAVLEVDAERRIGVVGTHLSHIDDQGDTRVPQARAVAATVAILQERQVPTVVLGDLNAEPGAAELTTFEPLVTNVLPPDTLTFPSDDPSVHIDHVLASSGLRATQTEVPEAPLSDHLPVVVELTLPQP